MKSNKTSAFLFLFLFLAIIPLQGQQSFILKKDIVVSEGDVQDNVFTIGGDILVEGKVRKNVIAFGGTITISGEVRDSVVGIGANITLKETAVIRKDLVAIGGILHKEPGCSIEGDTVYFKTSEDLSKLIRESIKGAFSVSFVPLILIFKLIKIFIWFLLALMLVAFFPKQISFASLQIRTSFWPVCGTGALAVILFAGLIVFSALLSLILIGIPILLSLILLGLVIKIFGTVVLFYFFGESLLKALGSRKTSPIPAVILGLILVNIIGFIPGINFLFSLCLSIIGWGVVIRTKFGTTENWFKRSSVQKN